jgi:hypothetical protein
MRRSIFIRIAQVVEGHDNYFVQRRNVAGALSFSYLQKVITACSLCRHYVDEYVCIGESITIEWLRRYVRIVCEVFSEQYLRPPNENDTTRLLNIVERRKFPGMLGSIDNRKEQMKTN